MNEENNIIPFMIDLVTKNIISRNYHNCNFWFVDECILYSFCKSMGFLDRIFQTGTKQRYVIPTLSRPKMVSPKNKLKLWHGSARKKQSASSTELQPVCSWPWPGDTTTTLSLDTCLFTSALDSPNWVWSW